MYYACIQVNGYLLERNKVIVIRLLKYRHMPAFDRLYCTLIKGASDVIAKKAILQVRIREEDKQHAERLYDAMGTSLAEAVRLFARKAF